jgi:long-chain fatty acid transport protein
MTLRLVKYVLWASGFLALGTVTALPAGFNVRSQSAVGNGLAHAGSGTSAWGLSSMFWNPATITSVPGIQSEINASLVIPFTSARLTASPMLADPRFNDPNSGNIGVTSLVPASYGSWQINDRFWIGMITGAPFGSSTDPKDNFAGSLYNAGSEVKSLAATPTIGIKLNDWISIGAGVTVQYLDVSLKTRLRGGLGSTTVGELAGNGFGVGFTAGVNLTPWQGGSIGIGFRSAIEHQLDGSFEAGSLVTPLGVVPSTNQRIKTTITLPETLSIGFRQDLNEQWSVLASGQWTNWSRLQRPAITGTGGTGLPAPTALGFDYRDEWMFAIGAEYRYNPNWTFRAGTAYEISPVTNTNRGLRILDGDRIWLSAGVGYKLSERLSADLSYSHLFIRGGDVNIVPGNPNFQPAPAFGAVTGRSSGHADVVSVALRYRWDAPATEETVIRKY